MSFNSITTAEIQTGKPIRQALWQKVKDNDDFLYGALDTLGGIGDKVLNGSFENDTDADGVPDGWTRSVYPGGSGSFETTSPAHGAKAYKFVHPGGASNGGGYLESGYIEVSEYLSYYLSWIIWASAAGIKNKVQVRYFDKAKVELGAGSPEDLYNSTANPTSAIAFISGFTPPATTKYIKIRLIGGYTDTDVAGNIYFDNVLLIAGISTASGEASAPTERSTNLTYYVKLKEIKTKTNKITVTFSLKTDYGGALAYGRIYKNGAAVGTERSTTSTGYVTYSESLTVSPTDLIQLWAKSDGGGYVAYVSDFIIKPTEISTWNDTVIQD